MKKITSMGNKKLLKRIIKSIFYLYKRKRYFKLYQHLYTLDKLVKNNNDLF